MSTFLTLNFSVKKNSSILTIHHFRPKFIFRKFLKFRVEVHTLTSQ